MAQTVEPARAAERRDDRGEHFILGLSDRLRALDEPLDILGEAAAALGTHLGVSRAGYAEVLADGDTFVIERDWVDGTVKYGKGVRSVASFGREVVAMLYRGETLRIEDARTDPRVRPEDRAAFEEMAIEAAVTVPLVKAGRLVAMFSLQKSSPRAWADAEVRLIEEVAERTWAAYARARTEKALRETQARQAFLLELGDRLREEADPDRIIAVTNEALGTHLGVLRVGYGEVDPTDRLLTFTADWTNGVISNAGTFEMAAFGPAIVEENSAGRVFASPDVRVDPRIPPEHIGAFAEWGVSAIVAVPLVKAGRFTAVLSVQSATPRDWSDTDLRLMQEVAERTWATLERARTAQALRESEARQAFLLALEDRLRPLNEPGAILYAASQALGAHLGAHRAGYSEVDPRDDCFVVSHDWVDGPLGHAEGRYPVASFGADIIAALERREPLVMADVAVDPRLTEEVRASYTALGIGAIVTVPLVKDSRLVAVMTVNQATARSWSASEVRLISEIAERTWSTLQRASAETGLRESQALLAAFMANAPVGMYLKDEDGRYLMANAGMERIFDRPVAEVIGRTAADLFDGTVRQSIEAQDALALSEGRAQVMEQHLPGAADDSWTLVIRFPIDSESQGRRIGGFAIDISEQKRAEAELQRSRDALYQSEKLTALGSLLAGVSHELNNPLAVVVGQSMMLEEDAAGTELAERSAKIRRAAERCARIVQTFLAMARQKAPARSRVDANDVVRAALDLTAYGLRTAGVTLETSLAPDLPPLDADADQLHQVLANLLVNAQQALQESPGERCLRVVTRHGEARDTIEVEVSDTGPGIPLALRNRVLEPFFTTKPQGMGTGLGLSYSLGVVERHGGRLDVLDRSEGAAFRVTLPVAATPAAAAAPDGEAPPLAAALRQALVVDDEVEIAAMIAEVLEGQGFEVKVAGSGAEAKVLIDACAYDVILSDLRMPDIDGAALHAWIAAEHPRLVDRLGFVTGDTMGPSAARFLAAAGRPCLEKPFAPAALRGFVADLLTRQEAAA